jgi:hypothetical protein
VGTDSRCPKWRFGIFKQQTKRIYKTKPQQKTANSAPVCLSLVHVALRTRSTILVSVLMMRAIIIAVMAVAMVQSLPLRGELLMAARSPIEQIQ